MSKDEKLLLQILCGTRDTNVAFSDLQKALENIGFSCRVRGDHFIYTKPDIEEIINIQPNGNKAKPYQVKQVRNIIIKYRLGGGLDV
jgi:predicted RNA binding protein YcfA (HicA-like mRNA interferase family)